MFQSQLCTYKSKKLSFGYLKENVNIFLDETRLSHDKKKIHHLARTILVMVRTYLVSFEWIGQKEFVHVRRVRGQVLTSQAGSGTFHNPSLAMGNVIIS